MRKVFVLFSLCSLLVAGALAQSSKSAVGTWKLDTSESDFGSAPAPKSLTVTVLKDTPAMLSWRVHMLDDKGKAISYSWSGPEDGTMHPVLQNGKEVSKQSAKREEDGSLTRHDQDPDGSSFDARGKISDDGNTITEEATSKSKDGKEFKQKYVYHRSSANTMTKKKTGN